MANSTLTTSISGRNLIEAFEGLFLRTYDDGEGVLTIGYGHTTAAGPPPVVRGMVISAAQADQFMTNDLRPVEARVKRLITAELSQCEFDALVSFEFNTGDLATSSIPFKINSGNKQAAMDTLMQYIHGRNSGRTYDGLLRRRKAERLMFLGDIKGSLSVAAGTPASMPIPKSSPPVAAPKPIPQAAKPSFWSTIWNLLSSIFRRK